jgi:hypothetical protein
VDLEIIAEKPSSALWYQIGTDPCCDRVVLVPILVYELIYFFLQLLLNSPSIKQVIKGKMFTQQLIEKKFLIIKMQETTMESGDGKQLQRVRKESLSLTS